MNALDIGSIVFYHEMELNKAVISFLCGLTLLFSVAAGGTDALLQGKTDNRYHCLSYRIVIYENYYHERGG